MELMSSNLTGPVHHKQVKSTLGAEIFAVSPMWDHVDITSEFYEA